MNGEESTLAELIERIEKGYEFTLAYAAQGRRGDEAGSEIRDRLEELLASLGALAAACDALPARKEEASAPFLSLVQEDRARAEAAVRIVLARELISSQLVDNLNASIHLRTLLTDLFLLDEWLRPS